MYTNERQKKDCLMLMSCCGWLTRSNASSVDSFISAELPDPHTYPELFSVVKTQMVHGPCGPMNRQSPYMQDEKCSKEYPMQFLHETQTDHDDYPLYRRRKTLEAGFETTITMSANRVNPVDNRCNVPYCALQDLQGSHKC